MRTKWIYLARALMLAAVIAGLSACDKKPTEPRDASLNSPAAQASASGVEVYQVVNSLDEMEEMLAGPKNLGEIEVPAVGSVSKINQFLQSKIAHFRTMMIQLESTGGLRKVAGDSIIYDVRWTDVLGIEHHEWVVYNDATGKAVVYLVLTHPTGFLGVLRDSTQINLDLNFTLADTTDDVFERLYNAKDFRADHFLRFEEGSITPDPYAPGERPTGGILQGRKVFAAGQDSAEVATRLEYHEGRGGSWEKKIRFANGKSYEEFVTFNANGTGTFLKNFPSGRREEGTFDADDSDHRVSFTKTTTFPHGANPRSVFESAAFTINPADSSWTGTFVCEWRFANGQIKRSETQIFRELINGYERLTVTQTNSNGTGGTWTLQAGATASTLEGSWIDDVGRYILIDATFYHDGSADMHLTVYASQQAFVSGAEPIFEATLHFNPDGSGTGKITSGDNPGDFVFDANGQIIG